MPQLCIDPNRVRIRKSHLLSLVAASLTCSISSLAFAQPVNVTSVGVTLQECFHLAMDRSTLMKIGQDQVEQADEQIRQARSGYFPTLALQSLASEQGDTAAGWQTTSNVNFSQNLFLGFRDLNSVSQRSHLKTGYLWAKKQAAVQLFKDVTQAFYSVMIYQSDLLLYKDQILSTQRRRDELASARRSGRARDSDVLVAESSIASLQATISRVEGQLVAVRETLIFLTGLTSDVVLIDQTKIPADIGVIGSWTKRSDQRPELQQIRSFLNAAEEGIKVAESGFYPSLGVSANYYLSRPRGAFQGVDWDAQVLLSFPFFSGELTSAQVGESQVLRHTQELSLRLAEEVAQQSIRTILGLVQSDLVQIQKLVSASDLSRRSYELVHRDNRLGVATNTDVINALQNWQESRRNLERSRIVATSDYIRLLVESNHVNVEDPESLNRAIRGEK